jgi:hypothetical protein
MFQNTSPKVSVPYGGFLTTIPRLLDLEVRGLLIDCFGASDIGGTLAGDKMTWQKRYQQENKVINYSFQRTPKGLWVGEYDFSGGRGTAVCQLGLHREGLEISDFGQISREQTVQDLIDRGLVRPVELK